jgi:membrane protein
LTVRRFVWELTKRTARELQEDNCLHLAAGVAYYALFSLFPLVLALIAVLGLVLEPQYVQQHVSALLEEYLPGSGDFVSRIVADLVARRGSLGLLALLGLLWSAAGVFGAIRRAVNQAWDVHQQRPLLRQKVIEAGMVFVAGGLLAASLAATTVLQVLDDVAGLEPGFIRRTLVTAVAALMTFAVVLLVYRYLPNTMVRWAHVWPAAALVTMLLETGKRVFLWYVEAQAFENYSLTYGPLAAVMVLLVWIYFSALVLLGGAELASEYGRLKDQIARGTEASDPQPSGA